MEKPGIQKHHNSISLVLSFWNFLGSDYYIARTLLLSAKTMYRTLLALFLATAVTPTSTNDQTALTTYEARNGSLIPGDSPIRYCSNPANDTFKIESIDMYPNPCVMYVPSSFNPFPLFSRPFSRANNQYSKRILLRRQNLGHFHIQSYKSAHIIQYNHSFQRWPNRSNAG